MQLHPTAQLEANRLWQESVLPELKLQAGWRDAAFSIGRNGKARLFTVWETQDGAQGFGTTSSLQKELKKLTVFSTGEISRLVYRLGTAEEEAYAKSRRPILNRN
jgi:hypothetical protein